VERALTQRAIHRLLGAIGALFVLLVVGTAGYRLIEKMSTIDALYMAVITVSTVGFGEVQQLSAGGRFFTIILIVCGGGIAAYSISAAGDFFLSGEWRAHLERRRHLQVLKKLNDHTIVCGYGRMGRHVVDELRAQKLPFVVLETNADKVEHINSAGNLALQGDASNEADLQAAGIEQAHSLVAATSTDADNVFIVLTARSLRPDLLIVARANDDRSEEKLRRAGANRVILPYRISGRRLVTLLVRPDVADFLDEVMHASDLELLVDQIQLEPSSPLAGQTLAQAGLRSRFGVTVLACRMPDDHINTRPSADTVLRAGAKLIVLGTHDHLQRLMTVATSEGTIEGQDDSTDEDE
jgi:voltage-gated potassium channel